MKTVRKCWPFVLLFVIAVALVSIFLSWRPILKCLIVRGAIAYLVETTSYEDLMDAAAFRHTPEVLSAAIRTSYPTIAAFAAKYPQYIRPGAKVGELERREGAFPPPPPRPVAAQVAQP